MGHLDVHSDVTAVGEERTLKQRRQDVIGNDDVNREERIPLTLLLNRRLDVSDELGRYRPKQGRMRGGHGAVLGLSDPARMGRAADSINPWSSYPVRCRPRIG